MDWTRIEGRDLGDGLFRPVLDIVVRIEDIQAQAPALLDSGADYSVVPWVIFEASRQSFDTLEPLDSDGGSSTKVIADARWCEGTIEWDGREVCTRFLVRPPEKPQPEIVLLGREDFFRRHVVRFLWTDEAPHFLVTTAESLRLHTPRQARPSPKPATKRKWKRKRK